MSRVRFSRRAERQLEEIYDYSHGRWGRAQARRYIYELRRTCEDIAAGTARLRSIPQRSDCFTCRAGSYVIVVRLRADEVDVLAILHQAMDLPTWIDEATKD